MRLHLSEPIEWVCRKQAPREAGVYIIQKQGNPLPIYIGLTSAQKGLRGRLAEFHGAATKGRVNHAGGRTYHDLFGGDLSDLSVHWHKPTCESRRQIGPRKRPDTLAVGNVDEWCVDAWHDSHEGADASGQPRQVPEQEKASRVIRGGSWSDNARNCRAAYRFRGRPDFRSSFIGFRCSRGHL